MLIQKQPNNYSCLPTAFAIVLNIPVDNIIKEIGHDGSEILWPIYNEPQCRRGFHLQECIKVAFKEGYGVIHLDREPSVYKDGYKEQIYVDDTQYIKHLMLKFDGVILGKSFGKSHAVTWDYLNHLIIDPKTGEKYDIEHFYLETFLMFTNIS